MRDIRTVGQAEVVADFLGSEFHEPEFRPYQEKYKSLVTAPDLSDSHENEIRSALLVRRRGNVWRELPPDIRWSEVHIDMDDLRRMRVFTRGHWARLRSHRRQLFSFVDAFRNGGLREVPHIHVMKIRSVCGHLKDTQTSGSVLLLGIDHARPTTILDGNNRLIACLLTDPESVTRRFRYYFGSSPSMGTCIFYESSFTNLVRYSCHRFHNLLLGPGNKHTLPSLPCTLNR